MRATRLHPGGSIDFNIGLGGLGHMCGIAGVLEQNFARYPDLDQALAVMNQLQRHRGPDGEGTWSHPRGHVGFGHRRLSIIDLGAGHQPMAGPDGSWVTFNGEIYNYRELRQELGAENFRTHSDTEVILHGYRKWGSRCVDHFRGMFAFAIWSEEDQTMFCARDRFGIKPFYYAQVDGRLYFASEIKSLLPFLPSVEIDLDGFKDYLAFQFCLDGKTLFKGVRELLPGHFLRANRQGMEIARYWEVYYNLDLDHTDKYFEERLRSLLNESIDLHLRSDVPVASYLSGGLDSSLVAALACRHSSNGFAGYTGKFTIGPEYDESAYARAVADANHFPLHEIDITCDDFLENIRKVVYHLDHPVAGPGSFPQYMVSKLAAERHKVVLGGQGGDEIFGGYTRYLIAYFEQCIKAAIDGTMNNGAFVVTYESIIPNLSSLRNYKPLLKQFWQDGLFDPIDQRYFRLVNRAPDLTDEIRWDLLKDYSPYETFRQIFYGQNVKRESYFDLMTHFDFKTLLPALLHVEDRVSMAHGLESRVPLLDHPLVELAAQMPANVKFQGGTMKRTLRHLSKDVLPAVILDRKDKMGFPVPLNEWMKGDARDFVRDIFAGQKALSRDLINNRPVLDRLNKESKFGRTTWGLLCLEIWQQEFLDNQAYYRSLMKPSALTKAA